MQAETLAAEYVALIDEVRNLARALAEGRWDDAADRATEIARVAEYVADDATVAGHADEAFSPDTLRAYIARRMAAGIGPRGVLEFLDPKLRGLDPRTGYPGGEDIPPKIAATLPPLP